MLYSCYTLVIGIISSTIVGMRSPGLRQISRRTVVCRSAQESGAPYREYINRRKKTHFSHLCRSVIPNPIGTKFARGVPAS